MSESNNRLIRGQVVRGVEVDEQTRCSHWGSPADVIAIKFPCCGEFYSCYECHARLANHVPCKWPASSRSECAVLCGVCGSTLTIDEYLASDNTCPICAAPFNPGCAKHYDLYWE